MRILIVTATRMEVAPLLAAFHQIAERSAKLTSHGYGAHDVDVLVTGVGMVATAAWCAHALARNTYDLALNFGVCGSFDRALPPGTVVHVVADRIAELGAEDDDAFLTIEELEPARRRVEFVNAAPPANPVLRGTSRRHRHHGQHRSRQRRDRLRRSSRASIRRSRAWKAPRSCMPAWSRRVPFAQVRAVSNVVEQRNRGAWQMAEAIGSLGRSRARHPRSRMNLSLGFSPCPNDCFMFDAIVNRRIDLEGLEFDVRMEDVEALNKAAFAGDVRRHQAELSRLRLLRRPLRAARRRQRARAELRTAADLEARRSRRTRSPPGT